MAASQQRSPEQIRASIEQNRRELGLAIERLQGEVAELTDWRKKVAQNQRQILIGAAVAGFLLGGGIAGVTGIFRRRR
jgi:3-dehydroquinate dehydratase